VDDQLYPLETLNVIYQFINFCLYAFYVYSCSLCYYCFIVGAHMKGGMQLIGHKSRKAYMQYNKHMEGIQEWDLQNIICFAKGICGDILWEIVL
jgi:hypothetical protein